MCKENHLKKCKTCGELLPINLFRFFVDKRRGNTVSYRGSCKKCEANKGREKRKTKEGFLKNKEACKRWKEKAKEARAEKRLLKSLLSGKKSKVFIRKCDECDQVDVLRYYPKGIGKSYCRACQYPLMNKGLVYQLRQVCCTRCGASFVAKTRSMCKDCKREAKRKNRPSGERHRKRAKRYGVYYEPISKKKVFNRDKWRCKECGIKTVKPDGCNRYNEATLGHIVPMSLGGSHSYANVQCECRRCNTNKGAKVLGQQLTVFYMDRMTG